ncbi:hypothetical protein BGW38_001643 [Lunasporangiospora selenospora]|uniref:Uncharacterized protein n=1 Tax=Lunasporangiospora selenospora TaxID=979761 RepID=A0A9P6G3J6_9FUNG|nr:hypothetical protein BGW38_001643 [Lunasporangiospora selenospora]
MFLVDVVAALLKAGADMTLASPMTHKTPLDLAESRLSYLLSRAQESSKLASSSTSVSGGSIDLFNSQALTTTRGPQYQSQQLLDQIKGIVSLLRPYVVRQQRLRHGERHKYRQKDRQWERAEKFVRQQGQDDTSGICTIDAGGVGSSSQWRMDAHSDGNYGDMEDEDDEEDDGDVDLDDDDDDDEHGMDTGESRPLRQNRNRQERTRMTGSSRLMKSIDGGIDADEDGDLDLNDEDRTWKSSSHSRPKRSLQGRRSTPGRRLNTDETEEALESLMNGLSLLEENRKQQQQQQQQQLQQRHMANGLSQSTGASTSSSSDIADGNLADSELDPRGEHEVDEALPDLLEQVQRVLESIKLNESSQGS